MWDSSGSVGDIRVMLVCCALASAGISLILLLWLLVGVVPPADPPGQHHSERVGPGTAASLHAPDRAPVSPLSSPAV